MKKAFAVGILALAASACGPDAGYYCEQSLECTASLGSDLGDAFADLCEDAFEAQLDACKSSEVDDIDEAIEDCKSKKGCDFVTCFGTKAPQSSMCLIPEQPPTVCGDDWVDDGEECDMTDLDGEDCYSQTGGAMPDGTLTCTDDCTFDTSGCM